jgi:hypothetical protein
MNGRLLSRFALAPIPCLRDGSTDALYLRKGHRGVFTSDGAVCHFFYYMTAINTRMVVILFQISVLFGVERRGEYSQLVLDPSVALLCCLCFPFLLLVLSLFPRLLLCDISPWQGRIYICVGFFVIQVRKRKLPKPVLSVPACKSF